MLMQMFYQLNQPTPVSGSIKLSMLDSEVTAKLDQNGSDVSGVIAGSLISVPYGKPARWIFALSAGNAHGIGLGRESSRECGEVCL